MIKVDVHTPSVERDPLRYSLGVITMVRSPAAEFNVLNLFTESSPDHNLNHYFRLYFERMISV
jgi:hypothetical protein